MSGANYPPTYDGLAISKSKRICRNMSKNNAHGEVESALVSVVSDSDKITTSAASTDKG